LNGEPHVTSCTRQVEVLTGKRETQYKT